MRFVNQWKPTLPGSVRTRATDDRAGGRDVGVSVTALRGLDDTLGLEPDESIAIVGASGGVGHVAVQLAKRMNARVLAVASGDDGVALADRLGADEAVDGHTDGVRAASRAFAADGIDAVLLTVGGSVAEQALSVVREGGRVAYPTGVGPEIGSRPGVAVHTYNGEPDREIIERLDRLIGAGPFEAHIARTFALDRAADAHRALDEHYLGKLALRTT
jgi:NADPH:quinone reductase-like Zn-dependent oxidoreductase